MGRRLLADPPTGGRHKQTNEAARLFLTQITRAIREIYDLGGTDNGPA